MKRVVLIATASLFLMSLFLGVAMGADEVATLGKTTLKSVEQPTSLKGRVWAQWADNPDNELLFGVQYWNTGDPASGDPSGRVSTNLEVMPPDPLFICCGWGFTGGTEKNNPYAGWYHPQTTVRLKVKDKALMDQLIKTAQDLVALEVSLEGRTITGFKVLEPEF